MAEDQNQRPYSGNNAPARGPSANTSNSGSDPLAELARLIGQNDPFAEFGRKAPPHQREPAADWPDDADQAVSAEAAPAVAPAVGAQTFGRQPFGGAPLTSGGDLYQVEAHALANEAPGYPAAPQAGNFEDDPYAPREPQFAPGDDDFYDDVPPNRRRIGVLAIAGVFALAVIGTAGAFGYRALFGTTTPSLPPPVIKAETAPSKIVPTTASKDAQASKMITDRINERGQGEKLVSREEEPVAIRDKPANIILPQSQDSGQPSAAALGSGIVGAAPKRIRTIAIRPDGADAAPMAAPEPPPAPEQAPAPARIAPVTPAQQPMRIVDTQRAAPKPAPAPRPAVEQAAPPSANAPLSLNPNAAPPPPTRVAPARRTAAVAPPALAATASGTGGYAVQVSSQRSEADAQAAFSALQGKFPSQLGGRQPLIHKADLGAKGIYYRAMVGPFASSSEAAALCSSLKAAGGNCFVQRN